MAGLAAFSSVSGRPGGSIAIRCLLRAQSPDLILASLLIGLLSLALPIALLHVYDRVLANASIGTFWFLASGVAVAIALETGLRIVRGLLIARTGAAWEAGAQAEAIDRLLHADLGEFEAAGAGAYTERLGSIATVRDAYSGAAFQVLLDLPFSALYVAAILHLSPGLAAIPVIGAALFLVAALSVARAVRRAVDTLSQGEERRFNMLFDLLCGIHTVKALGLESQMVRRYERLQGGCATARGQLAEISAQGQGLALLLSNLAMGAIAAFGCLQVLDGALTVGGLGASLMLTGRAMQPLGGALGVFARAEVLKGARARLAELRNLPDIRRAQAPPLTLREGRISLQSVRLLTREGRTVLDGVNLEVDPGTCIGLRGANGAGRSSLLRIMHGQIRPTAGRVLIDGQDLAAVDPTSIADGIALLSAQGSLVRASLIDNLTMCRPERAAAARAIAAELGLDMVAASLPQGYDTPLSDGSVILSAGNVQLIAIARALVLQPRVLLFDEANAHLDQPSDRALCTLLQRLAGHCTVVLVSDRPSTLALAQRQYVLAAGRLAPLS